jgi:hypothetical protein
MKIPSFTAVEIYMDYLEPKFDGLGCILIPLWRI